MNTIRINLSTKQWKVEALSHDDILLGGRMLTSKLLHEEVPAGCNPLGEENKIVIAAGALAGTGVSSSGRLSIGGKSPLTGGIKESNAGGTFATSMAKEGLRAIILEGKMPNGLYLLKIDGDQCEFIPADEYSGLGNFAAAKRIYDTYGKDYSLITIGQAGEQKLYAAGISITDLYGRPSRLAARGGLGAVMGSKGIKGIIINSRGKKLNPNAANNEFKKARKDFNDIVVNSERIPVLTKYGTASTVMPVNQIGALPTMNFKLGRFEKADAISGEAMYDIIVERGGTGKTSESCMQACLIKCSNVYPDIEGNELCAPIEYESICLLGSNIGIGNLDEIGKLNYMCNDYGLDTIDVGGALGIMAEAGYVSFGDIDGFKNILKGLPGGNLQSKLVGMGTAICGKVLGVERTPAVKNQCMSAYDPRGVKGTGITYATTPMGADHTAGLTVFAPVNHHNRDGQIELSRNMQVTRAAYDSLGLCTFLLGATGANPQALINLLNSLYSLELEVDFLKHLGKKLLLLEIEYNKMAGLSSADQIPEFFLKEKLPPFDLEWDFSQEELESVLKDLL
ncbi:MAG: hypothetical protein APF76_08545 [Desulfitibacter sp. BRH_c19]|nr:MAG: hypothetical protein APF76_08545 [Desulfitibacter sp. BRH_c19]